MCLHVFCDLFDVVCVTGFVLCPVRPVLLGNISQPPRGARR